MAKLLTSHDRLHAHAALGMVALLHFLVRFGILLGSGRDSFTRDWTSVVLLGVHFLLHATSFQFYLPEKRMTLKPMIWREFRVHNAIFAYRNLIGAAVGIWMPEFWYRGGTMSALGLGAKVCLVCLTCLAADVATERLGSKEDRTTNAMPYPPGTPRNVEVMIKHFYAKSQFAATSLAVFGTPMLAFGSVLAIEIASLLMTLVRKGKIEAWLYHAIYSASLFIMLPALLATLMSGDKEAEFATFRAQCAIFGSVVLRLTCRQSKYVTWVVSIVGGTIGASCISAVINFKIMSAIGMTWGGVDTLLQLRAARSEYKAQKCEHAPLRDCPPTAELQDSQLRHRGSGEGEVVVEAKGTGDGDSDASEDTTANVSSSHDSDGHVD